MVTSSRAEPPYAFAFVGGALCLDFTNTLGRDVTENNEHLEQFEDLVRWGLQAGLLDATRAERLRTRERKRPGEARTQLERARELREAIYRIFHAGVREQVPEPADLERLNAALAEAMGHSRLAPAAAGGGYDWGWAPTDEGEALLWPVVRSAAELLTSPERHLIRECGSDTCEWLFLDTTKNRRRRWCEMRSCGNRAKVRRHRQRQKGEGS